MFDIEQYIKTFFKIDNKKIIKLWEDVFEQMAVHTRKKVPTELLLKQRPNEETDIFNYRICNYRAITYGSMNSALDSVTRILNKINFDVSVDADIKEYLKTKNFYGYDFYKFMEKIVFKRDIEDPNGFLLWYPSGVGVESSSEKVQPKPLLIYSGSIYDASEDVFSYLSSERSQIIKNKVAVFEGEVYYITTKESYYKLIQIGDFEKKEFELQEIYKHNIGVLPVIVLGGDMNAEGFFESYFAPYVAFGDQAISQFSDWQAIMVTSGFPYTEEFYTECEINVPYKQSNPIPDQEEKFEQNIKSQPFPRTPFGAIVRKIPIQSTDGRNLLGEAILPADIPSKRFISPDINVAKYSGESWEKLIAMAEDALHLNLGNNSNQTEGAKAMDKEEHYAMIDKIACNFFDHIMYESLKMISAYRLNKQYDQVEVAINKPSTFKLKTEADLVAELAMLKEKKAPSFFLSEATTELAKRRFSGNQLSQKIFDLIPVVDPLYIYDTTEKLSMMASGVIDKAAFVTSVYAYSILNQIAIEKTAAEFIQMPSDAIKTIFDEKVAVYLPEEATALFNPDATQ
jgi:hypothetical protein